ncbi:flagellar hook-basal body complex protein [Desulfallas thermosapovorans]|uniref:Flagellar hook protein FlgE n=1 Tax=Desulfallas thermosapovorans DSM 6562 TaxID=1121431 RepID=A0A5S4ZS56_9FIRM|nr:flagellar hook-basal body complex protein [Desulfallas thermosapovorans]TYO95478.1 flagellar hook protein FlgE [Desulfallas thermosapovorans DSM 6562]
MISSLYSGILGMKTHQTRMDVIGNNISNVNTNGYKASRANFQDVMYQTVKQGSLKTNPAQRGIGTTLASINTYMTPGALQPTGRTLDLGISGSGFFKVVDGDIEYYTREGVFYLTRSGDIVNSSGYTLVGETWNKAKKEVSVTDPDAVIIAKATGGTYAVNNKNITIESIGDGTKLNGYTIEFDTSTDLSTVNSTDKIITVGIQTASDQEDIKKAINDAIDLEPSLNGVDVNFNVTGTLDNAELATLELNISTSRASGTANEGDPSKEVTITTAGDGTKLDGYTIEFTTSGDSKVNTNTKTIIVNISGVSDTDGFKAAINNVISGVQSLQNMKIANISYNGTDIETDLAGQSMTISTPKKSIQLQGVLADGTKVAAPVEIDLSSSEALTLDQVINQINVYQEKSGVMAYKYTDDNDITRLALTTVYNGYDEKYESDTALEIVCNGFETTSGDPDLNASVTISGYNPGAALSIINIPVADLTIQSDGIISGTDNNNVPIMFAGGADAAKISLFTFNNQDGLERYQNNLFKESASSGPGVGGVAGSNGYGTIESGYLEMSNVELTDEFSNMITTQRGYQANSRIITVSDTMLEELLNLKR